MNKSIKKVLVTGASLLMMASVGAGASQVVSPVHASRISSLRARRSRDYRDIKSINAELDKLEHKSVKHHRVSHHAKANKPARHESVAEWYKHNAKRMKWNDMKNRNFHAGFDDGSDSYDYDAYMQPSNNYTNSQYKHGWVIGYANNAGRHGSVKDYKYGLHYYTDGVAFLKSSGTSDAVQLNSGEWNRTD